MLKKLQHRGRDGFGLIKYSNRTYREYRAEGLVEMSEVNQKHDLKVGLGHTRYKTSGSNTIEGRLNELQPLKDSIAVMPEINDDKISECKGICSDYISKYGGKHDNVTSFHF